MNFLNFLKKPVYKEAVRVAVIMGAGDVIAQTLVEKKPIAKLDLIRTAKFTSVGLFFVGPTLRIWYTKLDQFISPHPKPFVRALKKMSVDQIFFAPIFTAAFMCVMGKVNQESTEQIKERFRADYTQILIRGYMLWPTAQIINFSVVPLAYQVIFAQCVAIIWNTYMSMMLNKNSKN